MVSLWVTDKSKGIIMGKIPPYIRTGKQPPKNKWDLVIAILASLVIVCALWLISAWANQKIQKQKEMETSIYQKKAMMTAMPSCSNLIYMLGLLHEEAGELQGKINKAQRKGNLVAEGNNWMWKGNDEQYKEFMEDCFKELGDVCWAVAGIAEEFDWELGDVMQGNIDKLADRLNRGVIEGKGDNR